MENVLRYYEFSDFFKDESGTFEGKEISYTSLNTEHFLIFVNDANRFHLYVSKYRSKKEIGKKPPEILELLMKNYDTSIPKHRIILRKYLY